MRYSCDRFAADKCLTFVGNAMNKWFLSSLCVKERERGQTEEGWQRGDGHPWNRSGQLPICAEVYRLFICVVLIPVHRSLPWHPKSWSTSSIASHRQPVYDYTWYTRESSPTPTVKPWVPPQRWWDSSWFGFHTWATRQRGGGGGGFAVVVLKNWIGHRQGGRC